MLVTSGSSGIGKATALGLATMGAHLAITGRDRARSEAAAREIRAAGGGPRDHKGVAVVDAGDRGTEADSLGRDCDRCQGRKAVRTCHRVVGEPD